MVEQKSQQSSRQEEEPIQTLTYKPTIFKEQIMQRGCMIQVKREDTVRIKRIQGECLSKNHQDFSDGRRGQYYKIQREATREKKESTSLAHLETVTKKKWEVRLQTVDKQMKG